MRKVSWKSCLGFSRVTKLFLFTRLASKLKLNPLESLKER